MRQNLLAITAFIGVAIMGCKNETNPEADSVVFIGKGKMPNATKDDAGNLHLIYANGDSIMYSSSMDRGKSFSAPALVSILPELAGSSMRGPQIAASSNGLTIIACNSKGDIFSYKKINSENWQPGARVNDVDTIAKEGLMALDADGQTTYAVWLDLRAGPNKIFGAMSSDQGKSWSKNIMIYTSPDTSVCECCKPSVVIKGNKVYVMFRNWLNGNRDLYLVQSDDGGFTFNNAQKLGTGSWALNGCPMDGGGLAMGDDNVVQTVWNREGKIYACEPGKPEKEIGEGRNCTLETVNGKNVYAWTEKDKVICLLPQGGKKILGKGRSLVIKAIGNEQVICVWENDNEIHSGIVSL